VNCPGNNNILLKKGEIFKVIKIITKPFGKCFYEMKYKGKTKMLIPDETLIMTSNPITFDNKLKAKQYRMLLMLE
jgi:hypothetical protein